MQASTNVNGESSDLIVQHSSGQTRNQAAYEEDGISAVQDRFARDVKHEIMPQVVDGDRFSRYGGSSKFDYGRVANSEDTLPGLSGFQSVRQALLQTTHMVNDIDDFLESMKKS